MKVEVFNVDDGVMEILELPDDAFDDEICDESAEICANCLVKDFCGNAKEKC